MWDADASVILTLLMLRASKAAASINGSLSPVDGRLLRTSSSVRLLSRSFRVRKPPSTASGLACLAVL